MSQKYTIVHFFEDQYDGFNYSSKEWPFHVTLLDIFALGQPLDNFIKRLEPLAAGTRPFDIETIGQTNFGPNKDIPVILFSSSEELLRLHDELLSLAKIMAAAFNNPEYTGQGFVPHAAVRVTNSIENGSSHRIDSFSLIDMYPHQDINRRETIRTFWFAE